MFTKWSEVEALPVEGQSGNRTLKTRFILSSEEIGEHRGYPGVRKVVVEVTTRHLGKSDLWGQPEKQYRSSLGYAEETKAGPVTTHKFGVYNQTSALLVEEPTPRYSAKGLAAAHAKALEVLQRYFEEHPALSQVFNEAAERYGVEQPA